MREDGERTQRKCKTHLGSIWLVLAKAFRALGDHAEESVRLVELTGKGRVLITKTFQEHAAAMEAAARVLSKEERVVLLQLLKKLGKGGEDES
jgi:hypothetical protein